MLTLRKFMDPKTVERTVGLVVREKNDPVAINRAFQLGCAGVIVSTYVPPEVIAEAHTLTNIPGHYIQGDVKPKRELMCPVRDRDTWTWSDWHPALANTCHWLTDELDWAVSAGLRPTFAQASADRSTGMVLWAWDGIAAPWHQDISNPSVKDVHIHIGGEGIVIASPKKPITMCFKLNNPNARLLSRYEDIPMKPINLDHELEEAGVELITLQPGEKLIFNSFCLHRSAPPAVPGAIAKLRAGIFT